MTSDARIAAIVRRTVHEQGLDLEVRDPTALRVVAIHILAAQHKGAPGTRVPGRRDHPAAAKKQRGRSNATP
jgi:hypothetical protein